MNQKGRKAHGIPTFYFFEIQIYEFVEEPLKRYGKRHEIFSKQYIKKD